MYFPVERRDIACEATSSRPGSNPHWGLSRYLFDSQGSQQTRSVE